MTDNGKNSPNYGGLSVGDCGPSISIDSLDVEDFVRYAGASGDFNPIHYDYDYAEIAGYSSVFAQGMLIAGYASQYLTSWFDIFAIDHFGVRFKSSVVPGEVITIDGEVTEIDSAMEEALVTVWVKNQDEDVVLKGSADVDLSGHPRYQR